MTKENKQFNSIKELIAEILDEKNKKPKKKTEAQLFEKKKTKPVKKKTK